jgi:Rrf2 family protein
MFSASCHYGLQAMFYIASHCKEGCNIELKEIAEERDIPKHFLSKILQQLVREKLLCSMKGPHGGFRLSRDATTITLIDIVEAIDGVEVFDECGIGLRECNDADPCPIHDDFKHLREQVKELFQTKTLEALANEIGNGEKETLFRKVDT